MESASHSSMLRMDAASNTHAVYRAWQLGRSFVRHFFCSTFNCYCVVTFACPCKLTKTYAWRNFLAYRRCHCCTTEKVMGGQRQNCNASWFSLFHCLLCRSLIRTQLCRPGNLAGNLCVSFFSSTFNCSRLCHHICLPLQTNLDICMTKLCNLSVLPLLHHRESYGRPTSELHYLHFHRHIVARFLAPGLSWWLLFDPGDLLIAPGRF